MKLKQYLIAIALGAAGLAHALPQSMYGALRESPITKYGKADLDLLTKAVYQALDDGKDGVAVDWSNPGTPNGGTLTPAADPKGRPGCRLLVVDNHHGALRNAGGYIFCKGKTKARPWDLIGPSHT